MLSLFLDIHTYELAPGTDQFSGDRADFAVADGDAIKFCGGHNAVGSAGKKGFIGGGDIVGKQLTFFDRDFQLIRQLEDGLTADAIQTVDGAGRFNATIGHQKKVAAFIFGEKAIGIENETLCQRVDQFDF